MNTLEEIEDFVARQHAEMNAGIIPDFLRCFDEDAAIVDHATASANWPSRQVGGITAQTPQAGNGHYAHLQTRHAGVGQHGEVARYDLKAPDWSLSASVTMPAAGGDPDVILEHFTGETEGTIRFARGAAARA